jgi:hypothetical protein
MEVEAVADAGGAAIGGGDADLQGADIGPGGRAGEGPGSRIERQPGGQGIIVGEADAVAQVVADIDVDEGIAGEAVAVGRAAYRGLAVSQEGLQGGEVVDIVYRQSEAV